MKLNGNGDVQWQKTYGGVEGGWATSIQQTIDGGYILAGATASFGAGGIDDAWVLKLDGNGNVQWQNTYGGARIDIANSIQQTTDGGYIVAGYTGSFRAGPWDVWVLKLDGNGNMQWQKTYGGTSSGEANSIQQTTDGGYIVAGRWVLKLDANGNVQWQKTYGGEKGGWANSIQQTTDGGYIVAGYTGTIGLGNADAWVLELDGNGNVQWQKTYGGAGDDWTYSIQQTTDGEYIVAGVTMSFGAYSGAWVLKLDGNGNVQWQNTYGGAGGDIAYSIQQTTDGGYIVAGYTVSFGVGIQDAWVLKLDSNGNIHNCSIMKTSNAQVSDYGTMQDTNLTVTDTYASPQTSTASVSDTNAIVTELCKYGCNLVPDAISVHRGGTLGLQATGTNYTNYTGSVLFATKVTLPNGNWYPYSGFLFGPISVYLGSYESKSGHLSHLIPSNAPLGWYTYHGYVGNYDVGNYSECTFNFEVIESHQNCTACHQ